ncbi:hypothetical protein EG68_04032 [Paragonimus skrjabini miyazakii]|uniref:Uncharacterized protein n=1 Tax=Paragonimus skrjabini miyazakii TaxID=59628 RepID=A0A8S9Z075_9TREM|nr:hypothetical protein EG68_04032 [Paragonimus skrjabini miyazakii]
MLSQILFTVFIMTICTNSPITTNALSLSPSEERIAAFILERLRSNDYDNPEDYDGVRLQSPTKRAVRLMRLG